ELKAIRHKRIVVVEACQRRHFRRIGGDKGGLTQAVFHRLLENFDLDLTQAPNIFQWDIEAFSDLAGTFQIVQLIGSNVWVEVQNGIKHRHSGKGFAEIVSFALILDFRTT